MKIHGNRVWERRKQRGERNGEGYPPQPSQRLVLISRAQLPRCLYLQQHVFSEHRVREPSSTHTHTHVSVQNALHTHLLVLKEH